MVHALAPLLHIEVKFRNRLEIHDWYDQAAADSGAQVAVVLHRRKSSGSKPLPWLATTSLPELALLLGVDDSFDLGHASKEAVAEALEDAPVSPVFVRSNALGFHKEFAVAEAAHAPGRIPLLVHARRDEDALWMAGLLATDLLEVAVQHAMEVYDWVPVYGSTGFTIEDERASKMFWEAKEELLAKHLPLYVSSWV